MAWRSPVAFHLDALSLCPVVGCAGVCVASPLFQNASMFDRVPGCIVVTAAWRSWGWYSWGGPYRRAVEEEGDRLVVVAMGGSLQCSYATTVYYLYGGIQVGGKGGCWRSLAG